MSTFTLVNDMPNIKFGEAGWISKSALPRDKEQSHRLHEPTMMISSIDPISGHDVLGITDHPSIVDGILTIYFESEVTRTTYINTPLNHPYIKLTSEPSAEDDRGG